ncbi:TnsD family Tn7-like transposition protein [Pseudoalteromonas sp. S16_S37]|uniref:TnsD family Tn7-like transposition protein n=1 Tax=Pseudoalteromonas sp. S16_S37 TaxID=2720228 RepID=UPI0016812D7B|nr:TnsD family Tn7-like transposition protein [Pseudoalteromonas sp. S16_S37]MBD1583261.1 transposase [Pseudoalteromonas sp. S16_S37]
MACLPVPYPDELLYSVIARYGVHAGITSPKQLLDEVFQNRQIIASVAFQGHLSQISAHYQGNADLKPYKLLQRHTLFPLYSPFVHPKIEAQAKHELLTDCRHSAEVQLGKAASKVKSPHYLRYCPLCVTTQIEQYGEPFWTRRWQLPGLSICAEHGMQLINSPILISELHRHQFIALSPHVLLHLNPNQTNHKITLLAEYAQQLLNLSEHHIHPLQWRYFYHHLAYQLGFVRGKLVEHELIAQLVLGYWGSHTLASFGLNLSKVDESNWLKCLFRKHRKSFSYLQHLLVWQACYEQQLDIANILTTASALPHTPYDEMALSTEPVVVDQTRRAKWQHATAKFGVKDARQNGFAHLYTWLYRHDKQWLMQFNQDSAKPKVAKTDRVDWSKRDKKYVRQLISLINKVETQLGASRHTVTWLVTHAHIPLSQIKYLEKLPLCKLFFNKYCETIEEYQCRRIAVACIRCIAKHQIHRTWRIERMAGLNEKRTRPLASQLLGFAVKYEPS